jgi:hypothetical protein
VTVAVVALLPAAWSLGLALVRKVTLRYRLTNYRLFTQRGLLARDNDEIELIRVDDVSVHQNVLQRVFDVGHRDRDLHRPVEPAPRDGGHPAADVPEGGDPQPGAGAEVAGDVPGDDLTSQFRAPERSERAIRTLRSAG